MVFLRDVRVEKARQARKEPIQCSVSTGERRVGEEESTLAVFEEARLHILMKIA
jgi:hypothetical protein